MKTPGMGFLSRTVSSSPRKRARKELPAPGGRLLPNLEQGAAGESAIERDGLSAAGVPVSNAEKIAREVPPFLGGTPGRRLELGRGPRSGIRPSPGCGRAPSRYSLCRTRRLPEAPRRSRTSRRRRCSSGRLARSSPRSRHLPSSPGPGRPAELDHSEARALPPPPFLRSVGEWC